MYYLLAVIIASIWGTTFVSTKVLLEHGLTPAAIFLARFGIAYLGMAVVARHRWFCRSWRDEAKAMVAGIAGGSVYFLVENTALLYAPAGRVSLLVCTTPLVTAILAALWRREHQRRMLWIGSCVALLGVSLIVSDHSGGENPVLGYSLALVASVLWAVYQLVCNPLTAKYGAAMLTRKVFGYGILTIIPFVLAMPDSQFGAVSTAMSDKVVIANVLYLGIVASLICYFLWSRVMSRLGSVVSANFIYLDPLSAYAFSYVVFGEPFTLPMLLGTVMVIGGIYFAVRPSRDDTFVAMWQVPGTNHRYRLDKTNATLRHPASLAELEEVSGFVFAPFAADADTPVCLIQQRGELQTFVSDADKFFPQPIDFSPRPEDRQAYHEAFETAINQLHQQGGVQKVVLARVQSLRRVCDSALRQQLFLRACQMYPDRYVALFGCRQTGFWLSVSPEVLVAQNADGTMRTMALAGTMASDGRADSAYVWSEKNRKEQHFVVEYIKARLESIATQVEVSEPYTTNAGPVVHLRSDFRFATSASLLAVAKHLHPTPAVCGTPADEARAIIAEAETASRKYYSGYYGAVGLEGIPPALYVTLRCAQFVSDDTLLYAGGGILAASREDEEWDETCRKMQTLLAFF